MRLGFILTVNLSVNLANPGEIVVFSHVECAGVMRMHSLVDFSAFQWSFCSHKVGIPQNDQGCQRATTLGECRGGYDLWRRVCM